MWEKSKREWCHASVMKLPVTFSGPENQSRVHAPLHLAQLERKWMHRVLMETRGENYSACAASSSEQGPVMRVNATWHWQTRSLTKDLSCHTVCRAVGETSGDSGKKKYLATAMFLNFSLFSTSPDMSERRSHPFPSGLPPQKKTPSLWIIVVFSCAAGVEKTQWARGRENMKMRGQESKKKKETRHCLSFYSHHMSGGDRSNHIHIRCIWNSLCSSCESALYWRNDECGEGKIRSLEKLLKNNHLT